MGQRVRATVNVRLVVTRGVNETDETAQNLRNNAGLLNAIVNDYVTEALADVLAYFEDAPDLFEVDVTHAIVNVDEVAA